MRTYCCRISKIPNSGGTNDNFLAKARKLSILSISLDIFDIRRDYIYIFSIIIYVLLTLYRTLFFIESDYQSIVNPFPHNGTF